MVQLLPGKHRRAVWSRSIRGFWKEYKRNKTGLVGLIFVIIYVLIAVFAAWLTPYDPLKSRGLADSLALPEWITIFPGLRNLPRTMEVPLSWSVKELPEFMKTIETDENLVVEYTGTTLQTANFTSLFLYRYDAPNTFRVTFKWWTENVVNAQYSNELFIINPAGNEFPLWTSYTTPAVKFTSTNRTLIKGSAYSNAIPLHLLARLGITGPVNVAREIVFTEPGEYKLRLQIKVSNRTSQSGIAKIGFKESELTILGRVHGFMGTDILGADVFSQLIFGSQISLAVGLASAILATSIGIAVGIISGYLGGFVDEGLMRMVDILMALPVLPLLLGLIVIFGTSVWYLVLLIAIFGWLGLSRLIRSQVLSIKELPFVESAKAAGATHLYVMFRHMLPNIIPVAMSALVLSVPAAILAEAGISFIGLGDPSTPTWGRMLNLAYTTGAFERLAWWWIIPPGAVITILTLSFVFIGFAVDSIVNPKLRRRR